MPEAAAVKLTVSPIVAVWLVGCVVMMGGVTTVTVAWAVVVPTLLVAVRV
jgi:hypothetical protein